MACFFSCMLLSNLQECSCLGVQVLPLHHDFGSMIAVNLTRYFRLFYLSKAAPATPTPSVGFNFAAGPGGMPGSPFASPAAAPTFGGPSTPQGDGQHADGKIAGSLRRPDGEARNERGQNNCI